MYSYTFAYPTILLEDTDIYHTRTTIFAHHSRHSHGQTHILGRYIVLYCPLEVWEREKLLESFDAHESATRTDNALFAGMDQLREHDARLAAAAAGAEMMKRHAGLMGSPAEDLPPPPPGLPPSLPAHFYQPTPLQRLDVNRHLSRGPPPQWPQAPYASPYASGGERMYYDPVPWPGQQESSAWAHELSQRELHSPGAGWIQGAVVRTSQVQALGPNPAWGRAPSHPMPPPRAHYSVAGSRYDLSGRSSPRGNVGDHYNPVFEDSGR